MTAPADPREALIEMLKEQSEAANEAAETTDASPTWDRAFHRGIRHMADATLTWLAARQDEPSPALRSQIEDLRDNAMRQGTWGIEYGDDRLMADVLRLVDAANPPQTREAEWSTIAARRAYWSCEVGPADRAALPDGSDLPMRQAVRGVFRLLTGADPEYLSSGWGRAARTPEPEHPAP